MKKNTPNQTAPTAVEIEEWWLSPDSPTAPDLAPRYELRHIVFMEENADTVHDNLCRLIDSLYRDPRLQRFRTYLMNRGAADLRIADLRERMRQGTIESLTIYHGGKLKELVNNIYHRDAQH